MANRLAGWAISSAAPSRKRRAQKARLRRWRFFPGGVPALTRGANLWRSSSAGKMPSTDSGSVVLPSATNYSMDWMPESMERCVTRAPLMT